MIVTAGYGFFISCVIIVRIYQLYDKINKKPLLFLNNTLNKVTIECVYILKVSYIGTPWDKPPPRVANCCFLSFAFFIHAMPITALLASKL